MLTYILKDIKGKTVSLKKPMNVSIIFSEDAPADSLTVVFAVSGKIPVLAYVYVQNDDECIFQGIVDEQTEKLTSDGLLLEVKARSTEALLLDNEACPNIYYAPSMELLMEKNFKRLGFYKYVGEDKQNMGELHITKGMSEWEVLNRYCRHFLQTEPKIIDGNIIDISGSKSSETAYINNTDKRCISITRKLRPEILISEIYARTYTAGGYEMLLPNPKADELNIKRTRYVNSINSEMRTVTATEELLKKSCLKYEEYTIELGGAFFCEKGSCLMLDNTDKKLRVKEIRYTLSVSGEKTKIFAEVNADVDS